MRSPATQRISFYALVILVTVAFAWLILPFYGALLWAAILAILFNPLQVWLRRRLGGRGNLAAALSVLSCICIVVIPGSLILAALARQATMLYQRLSSREFDPVALLAQVEARLPDFIAQWLPDLDSAFLGEVTGRLTSFVGQAAQVVASSALSIGQGTAQLFISLGVMLYVLFFLFRDGAGLAASIRRASPFSAAQTSHIFGKFSDVVKATVKGNVIIALIQGTIGGVTFGLLGIEAALLSGVVMAVLSLLPAVGAFLVWMPVSVWLLASGQYLKAVVLILIGTFVISLIDNLLRPPLVGKGTRLPDYVVLVSTLGGIALIGINGFVIGPLIAALFVAVWTLFADSRTGD
ncbi:AI-2E family transporter [Pseudogemmobacter sonorensis]|uniref:AI-2E family transporter n=1 Tax=Pseudogemmobacter sonorensis TaxID=2989681 RepID=UPI003692BE20